MKVLVIGGGGQLGQHLRRELPDAEFWDRGVVDLADAAALAERLANVRCDAIVNAAAYTAVDRAESECALAWRVNAEAPAELARTAERLSVPIVHVSTDYVFDGTKSEGYVESDPVAPLNVYGRTKLAGELAVATLCKCHWILRTSWVFSEYGSNFPKAMLRLARERGELRVVDDQWGRPTYAGDLARCIARMLASLGSAALPWGLHHVGGGPVVTWKGFADIIIAQARSLGLLQRELRMVGIRTDEYPLPAVRPRHAVLRTRQDRAEYVSEPFDWRLGLERMLARLV